MKHTQKLLYGGASSCNPLETVCTAGHMGESDGKAQTHLKVGGKKYNVVAAVLMMLGLIESYLHYQEVVPVFTGEVAHRIVELLKVCSPNRHVYKPFRMLPKWPWAGGALLSACLPHPVLTVYSLESPQCQYACHSDACWPHEHLLFMKSSVNIAFVHFQDIPGGNLKFYQLVLRVCERAEKHLTVFDRN